MPTTILPNKSDSRWFGSDQIFNELYPAALRALAAEYWTPLDVAVAAASFLGAGGNCRVLDIGSGAGKFCLAAAHTIPEARWFGVECRSHLVLLAKEAQRQTGQDQVEFLHADFDQVNLNEFDHFYFYNAFYEYLPGIARFDQTLPSTPGLHTRYLRALHKKLEKMPAGTRLATYYTPDEEIPIGYYQVGGGFGDLLKLWVKV